MGIGRIFGPAQGTGIPMSILIKYRADPGMFAGLRICELCFIRADFTGYHRFAHGVYIGSGHIMELVIDTDLAHFAESAVSIAVRLQGGIKLMVFFPYIPLAYHTELGMGFTVIIVPIFQHGMITVFGQYNKGGIAALFTIMNRFTLFIFISGLPGMIRGIQPGIADAAMGIVGIGGDCVIIRFHTRFISGRIDIAAGKTGNAVLPVSGIGDIAVAEGVRFHFIAYLAYGAVLLMPFIINVIRSFVPAVLFAAVNCVTQGAIMVVHLLRCGEAALRPLVFLLRGIANAVFAKLIVALTVFSIIRIDRHFSAKLAIGLHIFRMNMRNRHQLEQHGANAKHSKKPLHKTLSFMISNGLWWVMRLCSYVIINITYIGLIYKKIQESFELFH